MADVSAMPHSQTHDPDIATWLVAFGQRRHGDEWMGVTADELEISRKELRCALKGIHPLHSEHQVVRRARHILATERDLATALLAEFEGLK